MHSVRGYRRSTTQPEAVFTAEIDRYPYSSMFFEFDKSLARKSLSISHVVSTN